jgi:hypothetical protein
MCRRFPAFLLTAGTAMSRHRISFQECRICSGVAARIIRLAIVSVAVLAVTPVLASGPLSLASGAPGLPSRGESAPLEESIWNPQERGSTTNRQGRPDVRLPATSRFLPPPHFNLASVELRRASRRCSADTVLPMLC